MLDQIVSLVIRPPRAEYSCEADLPGPEFLVGNRRCRRHDVQLVNRRGHFLECSHYVPVSRTNQKLPCVIYCHGNSGCRADANEAVAALLPHNISVFALDFSGSGMSQGDYVTLGKFEMEDLEAAVDYLRVEGLASTVGLWGRSMGAVTALFYAAKDPSVAGIVLDSPFSSLNALVVELVDHFKIPLPKFSVKLGVLPLLRRSIRNKAGFDINDLDTLLLAPSSFVPALFGHATGDDFILPHHSERICNAYAGDKNRITFEGDHNSTRPNFFFDSVAIFFGNCLSPPPVADETAHGAPQAAAAAEAVAAAATASHGAQTPKDIATGGVTARNAGGMSGQELADIITNLTLEQRQQQQQHQQQGQKAPVQPAAALGIVDGGLQSEIPDTFLVDEEDEDDDAALQAAIAMSLLDHGHGEDYGGGGGGDIGGGGGSGGGGGGGSSRGIGQTDLPM